MTKLHISPDLASALADSTPEVVAQIEQSIRDTLKAAEPVLSRYFLEFPQQIDYDPVWPFSGGSVFAWLQSLLLDTVAVAPYYVEEALYATLAHTGRLPLPIGHHYQLLVQEIFDRRLSEHARAIVLDLIRSLTNEEEFQSPPGVSVAMTLIASLARTLYRNPITPLPKETPNPANAHPYPI